MKNIKQSLDKKNVETIINEEKELQNLENSLNQINIPQNEIIKNEESTYNQNGKKIELIIK